jgi:DNA-binding transcriptional ArsR family regulator
MSEETDVDPTESEQDATDDAVDVVEIAPKKNKGKANKPAPKKAATKPVVTLGDDEPLFNGATKSQLSDAASHLHLAGDYTRMHVLALVNGERTVGEITSMISGMTQPAVSHHIALIKSARLISRDRDGKTNLYTLTKSGKAVLKAIKLIVAACANGHEED